MYHEKLPLSISFSGSFLSRRRICLKQKEGNGGPMSLAVGLATFLLHVRGLFECHVQVLPS